MFNFVQSHPVDFHKFIHFIFVRIQSRAAFTKINFVCIFKVLKCITFYSVRSYDVQTAKYSLGQILCKPNIKMYNFYFILFITWFCAQHLNH